jgi:putative endopeptidase
MYTKKSLLIFAAMILTPMKKLVLFSLLVSLIVSCGNDLTSKKVENITEQKEVVFDGISSSIKPGDDFFSYVNKTWYGNIGQQS